MNFLYRQRKRLAIITVVLLVLWLLVSLVFVYISTRRAKARADEPAPALAWGQFTPFRLATSDGQDLGAWFVPGQADRPICLLLHGNAHRRTDMIERGEIAASTGCGLLFVSLRAHGDSSGDYNDIGYSAREDVKTAVAWIEKNHPGRPVVIWGESMGAAAATFAAEDLGSRVTAYILESPYRDLRTAVRNRMSLYLPVGLDWVAYQSIMLMSPLVIADVDRISPLKASEGIPKTVPVLLLAGDADFKATLGEAEAIVECVGDRCQFVVIAGADHGKLSKAEPERYRAVIRTFLASR